MTRALAPEGFRGLVTNSPRHATRCTRLPGGALDFSGILANPVPQRLHAGLIVVHLVMR